MHEILQNRRPPSLFVLEKMSYCLFHTGKNTSFSLFIIFFFLSVKLSVRVFGLKSSLYTTTIYLLTDLATLSHHYCKLTMDAHVQKESLVQKPICWPSKIEKSRNRKHNSFFYFFLKEKKKLTLFFIHFCTRTIVVPFVRRLNESVKLVFQIIVFCKNFLKGMSLPKTLEKSFLALTNENILSN